MYESTNSFFFRDWEVDYTNLSRSAMVENNKLNIQQYVFKAVFKIRQGCFYIDKKM